MRRAYASESRLALPPARQPAMAPGTLERACWACGVTAAALRKRSKGQGLLLALPEAGLLLLAQAAQALARLGTGPDGAPCGRPATHVLDGLCAKCWTENDKELKRRAQAQSTNKGRQLSSAAGARGGGQDARPGAAQGRGRAQAVQGGGRPVPPRHLNGGCCWGGCWGSRVSNWGSWSQ